jgi:hypothetical protein
MIESTPMNYLFWGLVIGLIFGLMLGYALR